MKTELQKERRKQLLRDVFADEFETPGQPAHERDLLLREFRLAYWRRKTKRVLLAVAAMVVIGILTSFYTRNGERPVQTALVPIAAQPSSRQPSAIHPDVSKSPEFLTDNELLNLFPPDSCFLAELDGKQVLVFKDPAVAAAVLH